MSTTASAVKTRLMTKVFDVPVTEKGSPLQSKFNAFTRGKNITRVHDFSIGAGQVTVKEGETERTVDGHVAVLLYEVSEGDGAPSAPRLFMKEFLGLPVNSELQTKVNSFTGGKDISIVTARSVQRGAEADVAVIYTKNSGDEDEPAE